MTTSYVTIDTNTYITHDLGPDSGVALCLREGVDDPHKMSLKASVASGEYFSTLATTLDSIQEDSRDLCSHPELHKLVDELLYLQQHYKIAPK